MSGGMPVGARAMAVNQAGPMWDCHAAASPLSPTPTWSCGQRGLGALRQLADAISTSRVHQAARHLHAGRRRAHLVTKLRAHIHHFDLIWLPVVALHHRKEGFIITGGGAQVTQLPELQAGIGVRQGMK